MGRFQYCLRLPVGTRAKSTIVFGCAHPSPKLPFSNFQLILYRYLSISEDEDGVFVDMMDVSQIPTRNSQVIPAQQFVQRVSEMSVDSPAHFSDASGSFNTILCFLIQSQFYPDNDISSAQNDATELVKAFASRSAADLSSEFLEKRLLYPNLCSMKIIAGMKDGKFTHTQESEAALAQLLFFLPDDRFTRSAAAHFPADCGPGGRAHVFRQLISMDVMEQRAHDAAATTSSLEEALSLLQ